MPRSSLRAMLRLATAVESRWRRSEWLSGVDEIADAAPASAPDRVVFSWDISPQWQLEAEEANASEVEVRFVAEAPQRTRLELEHRHLDRHGPGWESLREGVGGSAGWPLYLARYADLVGGDR